VSDFLAKDLLDRYRESLWNGIVRNIRNIYLANVKAYCLKKRVKNAVQMELVPDEMFMRFVECQISEQEVEDWRMLVWTEWKKGEVTSLDRLAPIFLNLARAYQILNKAFMSYPNDLDLSDESNSPEGA
jgi:hypothetical protein